MVFEAIKLHGEDILGRGTTWANEINFATSYLRCRIDSFKTRNLCHFSVCES